MSTLPAAPADFAPLRLRKDEDRRLRTGHLWVYSNEVDVAATPLRNFQPGQPVAIQSSNGKVIGTGYINPNVLLCARLVSRDPDHPLSPSLLVHRLNVALSLRERLYARPFYRLVYGEPEWIELALLGVRLRLEDVWAALTKGERT